MKEYSEPVSYIIQDDFFDKYQLNLIFPEIKLLANNAQRGKMLKDGKEQLLYPKQNWNVWVDSSFEDRTKSHILTQFSKSFWSDRNRIFYETTKDILFHLLKDTNADNTLLSVYGNGDFYGKHRDISTGDKVIFLTAVLFLAKKPNSFTGGDFVLEYKGKKKTIPFKHNRLVIFPSETEHYVTKVVMKRKQELINSRISIQYWAGFKR